MRIPEYREQFRYAGSHGGGRIQAVHGGETFAGKQLEKIGNNLRRTGYTFMQAGNNIYETEDYIAKAKATQMADEMKRAFMAKQTEYSKLKGENALNIDKDYNKFVAEQKQLAQRALGGNERALAYFNMSSADLEASQRHWVNGYRQGQEETYLDSVYTSSLQTQQEMFVHNVNNPELMMQAKNQGFALIQEFCQRKGLGEETAKQLYKNFMTDSFSSGVSALVAEGNLTRARTLLEHGKNYIGSDVYAKLKKGILDEQEALNAKWQKQKLENAVQGYWEQYKENPADAMKMLTSDKNLSFIEQQQVATAMNKLVKQEQEFAEIQKKANFEQSKKETNSIMNDTNRTDIEKFEYVISLPKGSEERAYANQAYSYAKRGFVPTASQDEFVAMYSQQPEYSKLTRSQLGYIYKDLNAQLDAMKVSDPVERFRYMEKQMQQIDIDGTFWDTNMSIYDYNKKVSLDPDYSKKELSISDEERENIMQNLNITGYETEDDIEKMVQISYKIKHGLKQ